MFMPRIDKDKCNLCSECLDICPTDVFEKDGGAVEVARPGDCLGCDSCIAVCEPEAITLEEI
jgi:NAD-dependent dihydropyrimidine dehydrogenase PreA subunit